jgi:hypothetical protein
VRCEGRGNRTAMRGLVIVRCEGRGNRTAMRDLVIVQ